MLRLINSLSPRQLLALLGLLLVMNLNAQAATADFVQFNVNCKGVLADVIAKGYSPLVVGYAVDGEGQELAPEAFETYKATTLRIPKAALAGKKPVDIEEAKEKYAAIAAAHEARVERIGRKKYEAAMKKCEELLTPKKPTFKDFEFEPKQLTLKVGQAGKFSAVAIWSDDRYTVNALLPDSKKLSVERDSKISSGFVVKGSAPGTYLVRIESGTETRDFKVVIQDLTFFEKLAKYIPAGWSGYVRGFGLLLLLALLALLFVAIRMGWLAEAIAAVASLSLIAKVGLAILGVMLVASGVLYYLMN